MVRIFAIVWWDFECSVLLLCTDAGSSPKQLVEDEYIVLVLLIISSISYQ